MSMNGGEQNEFRVLRAEVRKQRAFIRRIANALYKHARTDLAPDAALPELKLLVDELLGPKRPRSKNHIQRPRRMTP